RTAGRDRRSSDPTTPAGRRSQTMSDTHQIDYKNRIEQIRQRRAGVPTRRRTLLRILPDGVVSKKDMGACRMLLRICLKNLSAVWRPMKATRKARAVTSTTETAAMMAYTLMNRDG